jgi:hypothetical protein
MQGDIVWIAGGIANVSKTSRCMDEKEEEYLYSSARDFYIMKGLSS